MKVLAGTEYRSILALCSYLTRKLWFRGLIGGSTNGRFGCLGLISCQPAEVDGNTIVPDHPHLQIQNRAQKNLTRLPERWHNSEVGSSISMAEKESLSTIFFSKEHAILPSPSPGQRRGV